MKQLEYDAVFLKSLSSFIEKLNQESKDGALVVVEGKRDASALSDIGFRGDMMMLCHNNSVVALMEKARSYRKVILLLDFDQKGRSLTKKVATMLQRRSSINLTFRRELAAASRGRIRYIEELSRFREYLTVFTYESHILSLKEINHVPGDYPLS